MIKFCVVCANNSGLTPSPSLPNSNAKESLEVTFYMPLRFQVLYHKQDH